MLHIKFVDAINASKSMNKFKVSGNDADACNLVPIRSFQLHNTQQPVKNS